MSMILDGSNGVTFNDASLQGAAASPYVLKNRLINGAMVIDQRNAGASITPTDGQYTVDRWQCGLSQASKYTIQQVSDAPTGFTYSLKVTSSSSYSVLSGDYFSVSQNIEGYNIADFGYGTANATTITFSFWVKSSLTGTFGGSLRGASSTRSYPYTYTISSANTWEYKTITVVGVTSGTWNTTDGNGLALLFNLGTGSTYSGTAGSWASTNYTSATGATSVVGTNGATFYITGVQLEIGTSATPFERRLYGQELANCQRYFEVKDYATNTFRLGVVYQNGAGANGYQEFVVTKRANPSISWTSNGGGRFIQASAAGIINTPATLIAQTISTYGASISTTNTYNNGIGWLDQYGTMQISAEL
jgi:hypothetical protein